MLFLIYRLTCLTICLFFHYIPGLINISDKILVSMDTFLDLREQFKRGVPLTTAIESELANILRKATKVSHEMT